MNEIKFDNLHSMYGDIENVMKIAEKSFLNKLSKKSPHPVGRKKNPKHIILDLARFGIIGVKYEDSVSEGAFMSMW